ncbi:molybdopterin oxidoreductase family protein [Haloquadratum walsbyi]|uniref:Probable anaerobic dehydrogenase alpha subunit n=1 Tax=Haloquadratum walsbyi (strain DSM 16854 / JCM 12705 / C23) TaxID=768065 RepID=G0LGB4_HALWC|nr:molybdopterin-dependent oxidoreductase [Haloquadratum walsbyi]CCC39134.1 probable anaerobic dehydrogenase alpha subunit [Haloquadratum walsbyi C23]
MTNNASDNSATICPRCGVGCRLRRREDTSRTGRAKGVNGPANPNGRLCRRGINAFDFSLDDPETAAKTGVDNPETGRLIHPRCALPETEPTDNTDSTHMRRISWQTAYETICDRFSAVREIHGPDALAFLGAPHCTNEENYLLQKLARTLGTNNIDNRARHCHRETTRTLASRLGYPATSTSLDEILDADVIIAAGANPADRQPIAFNSFIRPAVSEGTTLIHIDPVGNETTRLADIHLAPRPGYDAAVFDLLSTIIVEQGGIDETFLSERTRNAERFQQSLMTLDADDARVAADIDAESLHCVAQAIIDADHVIALTGTGVDESGHTETNQPDPNAPAALIHLLGLTGNLGCSGSGVIVLRGLINEQGATDTGCVPDRLPGNQSIQNPEARARVGDVWGIDPPSTPGTSATALLDGFGNDIHAALVVGENPALSKRDPSWVKDQLNSLDTLVVIDPLWSTTAEHADVVLPAATGVEKRGTVTNLERRVQRLTQTQAPPGQARTDFRILSDLGRRLIGETFDYQNIEAVFTELTQVSPPHAGISYTDVGVDGQQWPFHTDSRLYDKEFLTSDGKMSFGTVQPIPVVTDDSAQTFTLLTNGRTSEVYGETEKENPQVQLHPTDAKKHDLTDGMIVTIENADAAVEATVTIETNVRQGTLSIAAVAADSLIRAETGDSVVTIASSSHSDDVDTTNQS